MNTTGRGDRPPKNQNRETADDRGQRLRILHIGKYFPPHRGGIETFLYELMLEQQRQGIRVSALVHASKRGLASGKAPATEQGASPDVTYAARWFTLAFTPFSPGFAAQLSKALRRDTPDIIHVHTPNPSAFWLLLLPRARSVPWLIHWHADVIASPGSRALKLLYRFYRPFEQALLKRASGIIVTSEAYLLSSDALADHTEKCRVVSLGIRDRSEAHPDPGEREDTPGTGTSHDLRLVCIGRLTYYKGIRHVVEAVASLSGVQLFIVGDGEERRELQSTVKARGVTDRVHILGDLSDEQKDDVLEASDCLCLPSIERTEAFGVVLLEAMRAGKATITTDVPGTGMSRVVIHGQTGYVVPPADAAALGKAIQDLRDNRDRCRDFGSAGRSRFVARYSIGPVCAAITTVYNSLS